nr:immunoglobulin light chain junction region [Macaca mulatta]MOV82606.1 immunoglobulin light chain junction region [Macaca mulatta]MOV84915.1 immunoglobulin light chain junction region [Macaca mulatta]MOV85127.1 immunoglobulin light chain junction region [Macaca mulatta]
CQQGHTYPFTF